MNRNRAIMTGVLLVVMAVLPSVAGSSYAIHLYTLVAVFTLFSIGLNIVFGHTNQLFLFSGGLSGISGYTTVIAANAFGVTPWLTIPLGMVAAGLVGLAVCYVGARLKFTVIVIAIFTLAFQLALEQFFVGARSITKGVIGLKVANLGVTDPMSFYYVLLALLVGYFVFYDWLIGSRYGMAFEALREDQLASASIGVDVVRYKSTAGLLAAMMIGLVGVIYGFTQGYMTPSEFTFQNIDILILIMLVVGGRRTYFGPIVGAVIIYAINEALASAQGWRPVVFGILLVALFLYFQEGIVPRVREFVLGRASGGGPDRG